jgi:hypothetical protein
VIKLLARAKGREATWVLSRTFDYDFSGVDREVTPRQGLLARGTWTEAPWGGEVGAVSDRARQLLRPEGRRPKGVGVAGSRAAVGASAAPGQGEGVPKIYDGGLEGTFLSTAVDGFAMVGYAFRDPCEVLEYNMRLLPASCFLRRSA